MTGFYFKETEQKPSQKKQEKIHLYLSLEHLLCLLTYLDQLLSCWVHATLWSISKQTWSINSPSHEMSS